MSEKSNALGTFLSARRALVTPRQAGIPDNGVRRVPGLRREEVAMLAGISADYYLRLERGRDRNPSPQVLTSIGRVLCLNDEHMAHLLSLAVDAPRKHRRIRPREETVPNGALGLLNSLVQPAFIEGRYFDILATNNLARALSPGLDVGGNQLRDFFLDPAQQTLYPEWEAMTECFVANLHQAVGADIEDPRFIELTGELSLASVTFRQLWARHEVRAQYGTPIRFNHPELGELVLNRERLAISGTDGQWLVIYHADAGSPDAEKLSILASAGLPTRQPQRRFQPHETPRSENHR
ncbi:helix-turn-helix transcriptional regulator [Actinoplanes sp. NPDC049265]|uniref:helix-turn-helix transcriptional regulator n=1 Tax=Actinoplanes sp. NPDC049265 TaxID=3363902 RepID=UPI0037247D3D